MNRLTIKVSILLLLTIGALETGCFQSSNPKDSSGSNWLRCQVLDDCSELSEAVACRDGYCVDSEGERIAVDNDRVDVGFNESGDSRDASVVTKFVGLFHFADDPSNVSNLRIDSDGTFVWGIYGCDFFGGDVGEWEIEGDRLIFYPRAGVDSFDWTFIGSVTEVERLAVVVTEYGLQIRSELPNTQEQRWETGGLCPDCSSVDGSAVRGPTGSPYACDDPYLWNESSSGESDAGMSTQPGVDGSTGVEDAGVDAGPMSILPSIRLERFWAGVPDDTCVSEDQIVSATIEQNQQGTEVVFAAEVFRGMIKDDKDDCDYRIGCIIPESIEFELNDEQIGQLKETISAIPEGDCYREVPEPCEGCPDEDLFLDGNRIYQGCSTETDCPGYRTAVSASIALIDRFANPDSIVSDAANCYSPLQNLELANQSGAVGCTCDVPNQSVCIEGIFLWCVYAEGGYTRWIFGKEAEDACFPGLCPAEDQIIEDDLQTCLRNWMVCLESPGSGFGTCLQ